MQPLVQIHQWIGNAFSILVAACVAAWFLFLFLRKSEDPALLVFKWVLTALIVGWLVWFTEAGRNTPMNFQHVIATLVGGLVLAAIWRHNLTGFFAKPFTSLYDGGDTEVEPQPFYSIADAKRKQGRDLEAITEIRKQLARFPPDYLGQLMLAEIQAQIMNDLPGAALASNRLLEQPGHAPRNVTDALLKLADCRLAAGFPSCQRANHSLSGRASPRFARPWSMAPWLPHTTSSRKPSATCASMSAQYSPLSRCT